MNESHDETSDGRLQFLRELLEENASIDGDVLEFGQGAWAIHGVFPYDGEVPMAVFATYEEATYVLDKIRATTYPISREEESS